MRTLISILLFIISTGLYGQNRNALELRLSSGIGYWIHRMAPSTAGEQTSFEHTRHSLGSELGLGYYFGKDWKVGPRFSYWMLFDTYMIGPNDNEYILDRYTVGDPYFGAAFAGLHIEREFGQEGARRVLFYAEPGAFWLNSIHPMNQDFERRIQIEAGMDLVFPSRLSEDQNWIAGIAYRQSMFREPDVSAEDRHGIYFFGFQFGYRW